MKKNWVIGITGASGVIYGIRLCEYLLTIGETIHLVITEAGWRVLHDELNWQTTQRQQTLQLYFSKYQKVNNSTFNDISPVTGCASKDGESRLTLKSTGQFIYHPLQDIGASIASGSFLTSGMVIMPCSMGTLSAIAHGASDNLLERTADVMLKEGRPLIMVPRETPLHAIHLENMLRLAKLGVRLIPAMPAFYHKPESIDELINFLVGKVLDSMDIEHNLYRRWGEQHD